MTTQTLYRTRSLLMTLIGALIGLLTARLLVQLFAGRPDNPLIALLLQLTAPLIAPLAPLDVAQPRFGAVLEISTLATMLLLAALLLLPPLLAAAARGLRSGEDSSAG